MVRLALRTFLLPGESSLLMVLENPVATFTIPEHGLGLAHKDRGAAQVLGRIGGRICAELSFPNKRRASLSSSDGRSREAMPPASRWSASIMLQCGIDFYYLCDKRSCMCDILC